MTEQQTELYELFSFLWVLAELGESAETLRHVYDNA